MRTPVLAKHLWDESSHVLFPEDMSTRTSEPVTSAKSAPIASALQGPAPAGIEFEPPVESYSGL